MYAGDFLQGVRKCEDTPVRLGNVRCDTTAPPEQGSRAPMLACLAYGKIQRLAACGRLYHDCLNHIIVSNIILLM